MKRYLSLALILFSFASLTAQSVNIGGYSKIFIHPNLNAPYNLDKIGSRLQFNLSAAVGANVAFYSSLDFDYDANNNTRQLNIYPVENYIDLYFNLFDVRVGNQFIFWGKTDWVNPTDNINPWDFKNITSETEDYRLPIIAAKFDFYFLENFPIEVVWVPRFSPNKIPIELPSRMGPFDVVIQPDAMPANKFEDSEIGIKISNQIAGIDYSLSYYNGFDKFPSLFSRVNFSGNNPTITFQRKYFRQSIFGFAFVTTMRKFAFKGEGAYYLTKDKDGKNIFIENPHLKYVLGIDFIPSDKLTLNLQFIQNIRFKFDSGYERTYRLNNGMPLNDIPKATETSLSTMIKYSISDYLSLRFISVINLPDKDAFVLPIFNYGFSDNINIYFGGTFFTGKTGTPFGRSKKYSRAFLEIKYSF